MKNNLILTLETYINACMNPFRIHEYFKYGIPLSGKEGLILKKPLISENILISWGFYIINTFYIFVTYLISHDQVFQFQMEVDAYINNTRKLGLIILVSFLMLKTFLYPIFSFVHIGFWKIILTFFAELLEVKEEERDEIVNEIISISYTSNLFLAIPFFGSLVQYIDELILMYSGIKVRFDASRTLTLLIVSFPYFLFMALWAIFLLLVTYLFS